MGTDKSQLLLDDRSAEFTLWHAETRADRADRLDMVTTLRL